MIYRPHEYQKYAIRYILEHEICAIFLDCGLGKTSITLAAIESLLRDSFEVSKVLVIAPLRVARETWPSELRKWDQFKALTYSIVLGTEEERRQALRRKADIYIINRENVQWLVEESNCRLDFDMAVVDELSSFKSYQAKRFKALMRLRPSLKRIVGLTGTPSSNGLMDLWAEYRVLDMGQRLGRFITHYRQLYFVPDKRNGLQVFSYKPKEGAEEAIYKAVSDITISMRSTEHIAMPKRLDTTCFVQMNSKEREHYDRLKKEYVLLKDGEEVTASNAAVLSGKLLQLANGCLYSDEGRVLKVHDRKLEALEDLIEAANGKPFLVAYWFKHDKERIEAMLRKNGTSFLDLAEAGAVEKWNLGLYEVGLVHPASCGHGLNLQAGGSRLVWFSLTWSLELYQQTNARLWRQGQKEKTVVVQHLLTKDTIDEKVYKALQGKARVQEALIEAVKAEVTNG